MQILTNEKNRTYHSFVFSLILRLTIDHENKQFANIEFNQRGKAQLWTMVIAIQNQS